MSVLHVHRASTCNVHHASVLHVHHVSVLHVHHVSVLHVRRASMCNVPGKTLTSLFLSMFSSISASVWLGLFSNTFICCSFWKRAVFIVYNSWEEIYENTVHAVQFDSLHFNDTSAVQHWVSPLLSVSQSITQLVDRSITVLFYVHSQQKY